MRWSALRRSASNASTRGQRAPKEVVAFTAAARQLAGKEALRRLDELKAMVVQRPKSQQLYSPGDVAMGSIAGAMAVAPGTTSQVAV
eukprot:s2494_g2.t1